MEDLRVKLEKEGYSNISYVVVNHQEISSRLKYAHLKNKVSEHIPVYQQEEDQPDVWTLLNGNKDDFLIYDRCVPTFIHTCMHTHPQITIYLLHSKCHKWFKIKTSAFILLPNTQSEPIRMFGFARWLPFTPKNSLQ